jgi:hypothetical protein
MARIRSVKPEVRTSLTVAAWPREVRLAWIYVWMYLDDEGRGVDDARLVAAECFPLDRDVSDKKMDGWLALMAEKSEHAPEDLPPLCRYEVAGRKYLHATKWKKDDQKPLRWRGHQQINRPQKSRLPGCPIHDPEGLF